MNRIQFIKCISILQNTNVKIFAIKVEDFTTASNKNFIHAFSILTLYIMHLICCMRHDIK